MPPLDKRMSCARRKLDRESDKPSLRQDLPSLWKVCELNRSLGRRDCSAQDILIFKFDLAVDPQNLVKWVILGILNGMS